MANPTLARPYFGAAARTGRMINDQDRLHAYRLSIHYTQSQANGMPPNITTTIIAALGSVVSALIGAGAVLYANRSPKAPSVQDEKELRILRALFGEDEGRMLQIYRKEDAYKEAFANLLRRGYIKERNGLCNLTEIGLDEARAHLLRLLKRKWAPR